MKYFRETVICGSVTRAAVRLRLTQPAVSKQLSLLADELGCELWIKRRGKLRLTESGRAIFQRAELILEQFRLMEKEVVDLNSAENKISGSLTAGCAPFLARSLLPQLSVDFIRQYPKVRFSIYESDSILLSGLLENGAIDIGIGAGIVRKEAKIKFTPLLKDEYLIIHSPELVIPGNVFQIAQLRNYPFINYMSSSVLGPLDKLLKLKGLNSILHTRYTETAIEFVKRNAGIAFMPSYVLKIRKPEGIVAKHLDEPVYQTIGIYRFAGKNNNPAHDIFTARIKEAFGKLT